MPNERLRAALLERGLTLDEPADSIDVDPKTVERWVTTGRTPYHPIGGDTLRGVNRRKKGAANTPAALKSIRATRPDGVRQST